MAKNQQLQAGIFFLVLIIFSLIIIFASIEVLADVVSPTDLTHVSGSKFDASSYPSKSTDAIAGNVTELTIIGVSPTKAWQGYYGNITGTITLQDSSGNVFYNWSVAEPKGEIYASRNSSISWASINCFNFTANGTPTINLSMMQTDYNIDTNDADSINNTFNMTSHSTFYVGSITISSDTCPSTYVFDNTGWQTTNFQNILLTDNSSLVFTTIIENDLPNQDTDPTGYNGERYDFQMLVAEDGHGSDTAPTTYYFWIEIE